MEQVPIQSGDESELSSREPESSEDTSSPTTNVVDTAFRAAMADECELVEGRLYYIVEGVGLLIGNSISAEYGSQTDLHFFHIQGLIRYFPFCQDFGPYNLGAIFRFLEILGNKLEAFPNKTIVLCTGNEPETVTNACFLLGAYLILELGFDPESQVMPLSNVKPCPFKDFRDATYGPVSFGLHIRDTWRGLSKGKSLGWFAVESEDAFDLEEYEHYDNPGNGDLHVMVPNKIIAFKGPSDAMEEGRTWVDLLDKRIFHPRFYVDIFKDMGVTCVVRLNEPQYNPDIFSSQGIEHVDLYFSDCTVPPPYIVVRFLQIVERTAGLIAVHCKAGLGRTGTLIGLYLMKRHGFTARAAIGFLRILRPGSIIGIQQQFLVDQEETMRAAAAQARNRSALPPLTQQELRALQFTQDDAVRRDGMSSSSSSSSDRPAHPPSALQPVAEQALCCARLGFQVIEASNRRGLAIMQHHPQHLQQHQQHLQHTHSHLQQHASSADDPQQLLHDPQQLQQRVQQHASPSASHLEHLQHEQHTHTHLLASSSSSSPSASSSSPSHQPQQHPHPSSSSSPQKPHASSPQLRRNGEGREQERGRAGRRAARAAEEGGGMSRSEEGVGGLRQGEENERERERIGYAGGQRGAGGVREEGAKGGGGQDCMGMTGDLIYSTLIEGLVEPSEIAWA